MKGNLANMNNGAGQDGRTAELGNANSSKAKKANVG
jgi:hypothetical protein